MVNPTNKIRAMLDELGIEWKSETNCDTYWYGQDRTFCRFTEYSDGTTSFSTCQWNLTPKQVLTTPIAATVGVEPDEPDEATMLKLHERMNAVLLDMQEELLAYHPQDRENASSKELIDCVIRAHQIVEDAATVDAGTCHMEVKDNLAETEGMGEVWLECDRCHWQMPLEPTTPRFKYCPNCRSEIKED